MRRGRSISASTYPSAETRQPNETWATPAGTGTLRSKRPMDPRLRVGPVLNARFLPQVACGAAVVVPGGFLYGSAASGWCCGEVGVSGSFVWLGWFGEVSRRVGDVAGLGGLGARRSGPAATGVGGSVRVAALVPAG